MFLSGSLSKPGVWYQTTEDEVVENDGETVTTEYLMEY